jgi:hypothetical protein
MTKHKVFKINLCRLHNQAIERAYIPSPKVKLSKIKGQGNTKERKRQRLETMMMG